MSVYFNDRYMRYNLTNNIVIYVFTSNNILPYALLNLYKSQRVPKPGNLVPGGFT